jgi:multidrug efflux pump subunit AcrB
MDRFNLSAWGVRNGSLTLFAILLLAVLGGGAYLKLGRAEDPSFTLKVMVVSAAWPGASAEEMQAQVADRIESRLQDLAQLDTLQTYVRPGNAVITITLRDTTPPREVAGLWYQVRKKVGDIAGSLPAGVRGPFFNDEYSDVYSAVLALTGAENPELVRQAEAIRLRLLRLPGVEKVAIQGEIEQRIFVSVSHARLATLGIGADAILDALARQNPVAPAGVVETGALRVHLRVDGGLDGLEAIRNVPVSFGSSSAGGGRTLRLGDIAHVSRGLADPPATAVFHDGVGAVMISVVKQRGFNVLNLGESLRGELEDIRRDLPVGLELQAVSDQPRIVAESVAEFLTKFAAALAVVLLVSFLSLGFRAGIIVALSVPLTLAAVFLMMLYWGTELERISLGALILALGLLVDDAIIAIETMAVKLEEGWDRKAGRRLRLGQHGGADAVGHARHRRRASSRGLRRPPPPASMPRHLLGGRRGADRRLGWSPVWFTPWLGVKLLADAQGSGRSTGSITTRLYDGRGYRLWAGGWVAWCVDFPLLVRWRRLGVLAAASSAWDTRSSFPTSRAGALGDVNLRPGRHLRGAPAPALDRVAGPRSRRTRMR